MTNQLKNDIKTIIELLTYIVITFCLSFVYTNTWIAIIFSALWIGRILYKAYFVVGVRNRSDIILFPTQNDEYSKMTPITFGIIILIISIIGYFAFGENIYYSIIGTTIGAAVFLFGFFRSPNGWILIKNNSLELYGIQGETDTRQLREITLKNDKITLTNIYGENKNSNLLNLNQSNARDIKRFLEEKLNKSEILIVDGVTDHA
jgi:hypothetical protein